MPNYSDTLHKEEKRLCNKCGFLPYCEKDTESADSPMFCYHCATCYIRGSWSYYKSESLESWNNMFKEQEPK